MEKIIQYLIDNKEWIFSGIGITVVLGIYKLFKRNKNGGQGSTFTFNQKSGKNSNNYQGHTLNINPSDKNKSKKEKENV
ncbi:hypothetical protein COJ67_16590 [Bacillus thuringiensis]|uniref:hypothetical protein n=1 Tax=Bacillus thuringiensis TaxID=1428 RepID=UPI000BF4A9A1|nr:hypothetical protein [Bacillus thuringiensis]PFN86366.1 hypothetical protein COJ67_16590 [Bacillus thuringiensis]PGX99256.1 hypothetical protein COE41_17295 [Bacillus thuringiensis]